MLNGLTQCEECGQQISREAETCPHCGIKTAQGVMVDIERGELKRRVAGFKKYRQASEAKGYGCFLILVAFGVAMVTGGGVLDTILFLAGAGALVYGFLSK